MTTEYDELTRRSIEAKRRLDQAEEGYQRAVNGVDGVVWIARRRRDRALQAYLAIEAERKRAAPPPEPAADSGPTRD
jgi:multidrug resistance efflux pump